MPNTPVPAAGEAMPAGIADPIIDAIKTYKEEVRKFAAIPDDVLMAEGEDATVANTYGPHQDRLMSWSSPAATREGAIDALRLMIDEDAICSSMGEAMCRAALAYLEGLRLCGANIIPAMYAEWLSVKDAVTPDGEEEPNPSRYQQLQAAIIAAEPLTPQDVAIMYIVDTDDCGSDPSDFFLDRVRQIADGVKLEPAPDPLLTAITNYRNGCVTLNSIPFEFITKDNENDIFDAIYRPHVDALIGDAPAATTLAGVREAIQLVFDEDAIDDMIAEGALRAALAYFDGKAVQQ